MKFSDSNEIKVHTMPTCIDGVTVRCGAFVDTSGRYLMAQGKLVITSDNKFIKVKY